jgi:urease subunit gamma
MTGETYMHFTPREIDKLMIYTLAQVAQQRKDQGLKLNHPETVSLISVAALNGARAGKTVEEVMEIARKEITRDDVMEGVVDMIPYVQVEAVFTDGSRLVTIHDPIQ